MARLINVNGARSTIARVRPKRNPDSDVSIPDALLPEQYFSRAATAVPERRLMFAILLDAITQLERRGTEGAEEAKRWIRRVADDAPCSFRGTCEAVGIEPIRLGRGLLAWYAGDEPHLLGPTRLRSGRQRGGMTARWPRRRVGRPPSSRAMPLSSAPPAESPRQLVLNEARP